MQGLGVLLEAKSEVGGRTYSERLDGAVIERGAEFYHPDHHARCAADGGLWSSPQPLPKSAEVTWLCEAGEARRWAIGIAQRLVTLSADQSRRWQVRSIPMVERGGRSLRHQLAGLPGSA